MFDKTLELIVQASLLVSIICFVILAWIYIQNLIWL